MTTSHRPAPRGSLNLRTKPELCALLDPTVFTVSRQAYAEFLARFDAPPQPNERLRRTMQTPAPWDRD